MWIWLLIVSSRCSLSLSVFLSDCPSHDAAAIGGRGRTQSSLHRLLGYKHAASREQPRTPRCLRCQCRSQWRCERAVLGSGVAIGVGRCLWLARPRATRGTCSFLPSSLSRNRHTVSLYTITISCAISLTMLLIARFTVTTASYVTSNAMNNECHPHIYCVMNATTPCMSTNNACDQPYRLNADAK